MMLQKVFDRIPAIAGILGVVCLLTGVGSYLITSNFDQRVWVFLIAGVALLAIVASYYPQEIVEMLRGRQARYGSNTLVMALAFLAILALLNFLSVKRSYRFDLTEAKEFSLSQQTVSVVQKLQGPVKATHFYDPQDASSRAIMDDLLKEYRVQSDRISYEFVDPFQNPVLARQYKIQSLPVTVIEYQGKRQDVNGMDEQQLTSALLKLTRGAAKKVYFLVGHGELDMEGLNRDGGDLAKKALQADNYDVAPLTLAAAGSVPDDAAVVVIAGPKNPLREDEKRALKEYLEKGGKALVMVDPTETASVSELVQPWGVEIGSGLVLDPAMSPPNQPQLLFVARYNFNPITKDLQQMTLLPVATSVTPKKELPKGVSASTFIDTSDRSWLAKGLKVAPFQEGTDVKGPLSLAVTVQGDAANPAPASASDGSSAAKPKTRLVVVGNVGFAENELLQEPSIGNKDLFVNAVNWLAEEEDLITVRAKEPENRTLFLTGSDANFVFYTSVIFLPLAVLLIGGAVWWNRR
ncbi:MAG: GldG family protein [Chloroflexi bacterium]|nr:GldG family protein [Chloroflexota bacterium]